MPKLVDPYDSMARTHSNSGFDCTAACMHADRVRDWHAFADQPPGETAAPVAAAAAAKVGVSASWPPAYGRTIRIRV